MLVVSGYLLLTKVTRRLNCWRIHFACEECEMEKFISCAKVVSMSYVVVQPEIQFVSNYIQLNVYNDAFASCYRLICSITLQLLWFHHLLCYDFISWHFRSHAINDFWWCWCNEDVANEDGLPKANAARTNLPVQPVSNSFHSLRIASTVAVDATADARFIVDEWMCSEFLGEAARTLHSDIQIIIYDKSFLMIFEIAHTQTQTLPCKILIAHAQPFAITITAMDVCAIIRVFSDLQKTISWLNVSMMIERE